MSFEFEIVNTHLNLPDSYQPYNESYPGSYQLSNFGMLVLQEVMGKANILDGKAKNSFFRKLLIKILILTKSKNQVLQKYALGRKSKNPCKIPMYKLDSSDGWFISPHESKLIAETLTKHQETGFRDLTNGPISKQLGQEETKSTISEWLQFNFAASLNGGYRVW